MILKILVQIYFFKLSIYQLTPYLTLKESYFMPRFFFFFCGDNKIRFGLIGVCHLFLRAPAIWLSACALPLLVYKSYCNMAKYVHAPKAILASNH